MDQPIYSTTQQPNKSSSNHPSHKRNKHPKNTQHKINNHTIRILRRNGQQLLARKLGSSHSIQHNPTHTIPNRHKNQNSTSRLHNKPLPTNKNSRTLRLGNNRSIRRTRKPRLRHNKHSTTSSRLVHLYNQHNKNSRPNHKNRNRNGTNALHPTTPMAIQPKQRTSPTMRLRHKPLVLQPQHPNPSKHGKHNQTCTTRRMRIRP